MPLPRASARAMITPPQRVHGGAAMTDRIDPFATATEMLAALDAGKVSAVELLELHRRRIERHNPALNAIVEPDFERARGDAEAADARRARGESEIGRASCRDRGA